MLTVTQATSSSRPEVVEPPQAMSTISVEAPPVFDAGDILIPGPVSTLHYFRGSSNLLNTQDNPCYACSSHQWPCASRRNKRTGALCLSCVYCTTKKIKCTPANMGTPPKRVRGKSTTHQTRSGTPSTAPSNVLSTLQLRACTCSQSCGPSGPPAASAVTTPKAPKRSHSKTITAVKAPAPAPAPACKLPSFFMTSDLKCDL
jgi:hypothetical protein